MRLYFGLISIALVVAALSGAALSWDGCYYLFKVLDSGQPFIPPNRYLGYVLQLSTLAVRVLTDDLTILQTVFGLTYAVVPLLALAACWWVVRRDAPALFIWPALSIGVGLLPGIFFLTAGGVQAVALFWPVLLGTLLGLPRTTLPVVAVFALLTFLAHPSAGVLLLIAGGVALWAARPSGEQRGRMLAAAATFAVLGVARFAIHQTVAGSEVTTLAGYSAAYDAAVKGYPLFILGATWLAGITVLAAALTSKSAQPEVAPALRSLQYVGLGVAGVLGLAWARHPRLWANELQFTDFALLSSVLFILLAIFEGIIGREHLRRAGAELMARRLPLIQGTAIVFVGVLSVQSILFSNLTNDLYQVIEQSAAPCISTSSLGSLHGTPLGHWSVATLAIALQGRSPQKLLLDGEGCVTARSTGSFRVVEWDTASGNTGWFNLSQVRSRAEATRACWYSVSPGWYGVERGWYAAWWRWSAGQGQVRVVVERAGQVTMRAALRSLRQPNRAEIVLNGERQAVETLTLDDFGLMTPLVLNLRAGENTIEIRSELPALLVPNDSRPLALAVKNLDFFPQEPGVTCELQP